MPPLLQSFAEAEVEEGVTVLYHVHYGSAFSLGDLAKELIED